MSTTGMFDPHPNLADEVNRGIIQSEIEGGVFLNDLPPSTVLEIQTMHHRYTAVLLGGSEALLSGHPEFCPEPVQVAIAGSTWGGLDAEAAICGTRDASGISASGICDSDRHFTHPRDSR